MNIYESMNDRQKEAMLHLDGPELILAGAGSGKTRVLTHRIAWLIGEQGIAPWHILAITFTNKAAKEMRDRVDRLVENGAGQVWVATFHSTCVRILRRFGDKLGYDNRFNIYDADDQKSLMKQVFKELSIDRQTLKERAALSVISGAKNELIGPQEFMKNAADWQEELIGKCYLRYQSLLRQNNALDFADLLTKTVELFEQFPEILSNYQERFRYILVDEYQDTNRAQFRLVELLAGKYRNLCVVGDDDQSIYRFRGADIGNILDFEKCFPGAHVVKLEQNYRSTGNILAEANRVIRNNRGRKDKKLWTEQGEGSPVRVLRVDSARDEAETVADEIKYRAAGGHYNRFAVLYRTNAQSRLLEERFVAKGIPYQLVGGVNFYQRREIKDILAYLRVLENPSDDMSVRRILNVPKRGIGAATIAKTETFAAANGLDFYEGLKRITKTGLAGRSGEKIRRFTDMMEKLREEADVMPAAELIEAVLKATDYEESLKEEGPEEAESRMENLKELLNKAAAFDGGLAEADPGEGDPEGADSENADPEKADPEKADLEEADLEEADPAEGPGEEQGTEEERSPLSRFLDEVSLVADIDRMDETAEKVTLMTLHAAKGLEFPEVYLTGMEDGLFPGFRSFGDPAELEEERRLCYVGITRAMERLTLVSARTRMVNGELMIQRESRFIGELPEDVMEEGRETEKNKDTVRVYIGADGKQESGKAGASGGKKESQVLTGGRMPWESGYVAPRGAKAKAGFRRQAEEAGRSGQTAAGGSSFGKNFRIVKADRLDYGVGDRVRHQRFGEGTVKAVEDGAKDYEVTVEFDGHGTKKMFAGFAKLIKL